MTLTATLATRVYSLTSTLIYTTLHTLTLTLSLSVLSLITNTTNPLKTYIFTTILITTMHIVKPMRMNTI